MSLKISHVGDDPYGGLITSFLSRAFPANLIDRGSVLDALTAAFVSTNNTRLGPAPKPEGLVEIRKRISYWLAKDEPIAVLSPWGSKKTVNGRTIDVAEVAAVRQLEALNERVGRFYPPGIRVQFGVEDLGGQYLWQDEGMETLVSSDQYVLDFVKLIRILAPWGQAVPESRLVGFDVFRDKADTFYNVLQRHLYEPASAKWRADLTALGWVGDGVEQAQVDFYLHQYEKLYPTADSAYRRSKLARYLAQSAARYAVGAKLADKSWAGHYVQVNFPLPVPGLPSTLGDSRLYYRTLPASVARTHMPPWRSKGYLVVGNDVEDVTPKLATWAESKDYHRLQVNISDSQETVCVDADYVLKTNWLVDSMTAYGHVLEASGGLVPVV